jgi:acyl dehydratase
MLPAMSFDAVPSIEGALLAVNYGLDRVRFVAPVRSGARVRAKFKLVGITPRGPKELIRRSEVTIEIEGISKPALVADLLEVVFLAKPHGLDSPASGA